MYCDYFFWCVSCTVVVLTCFVMCVCACVCVCVGGGGEGVGFVKCGCFGNMSTCIYRVFQLFVFLFVLFHI